MQKLINMLKKNDNAYSIARVLTIWESVLWSIITVFLVLTNREWKHYDTFTCSYIATLMVVLCDKTFQGALFTLKGGKDV